MNRLILCFCLSLSPLLSYCSNIPPDVRDELCDYQKLLDGAKSENERMKREELYLKMLGILESLAEYRSDFLRLGNLIDLFPTAYYHTTLSELQDIKNNDFSYPIEKMNQLIAFYDAYQQNRLYWKTKQNSLIEAHWFEHFFDASKGIHNGINFACSGIAFVLESGIEAHVKYDLPRAIRYAYRNRDNQNLTASDLIQDFNKTDRVFASTNQKTKADISLVRDCSVWWQNRGESYFGDLFLTDGDVIKMRKKAWSHAHDGTQITGIDGSVLARQPITNHQGLYQKGKGICHQKADPILFLFDLSGSMNDNGGGTIPKVEQAKNASKQTLDGMRSNNQGVDNQVAAYGFAGSCIPDPTIEISPFDGDLDAVEQKINTMRAGGGTPLGNAIRAAECKMAAHLQKEKQKEGKIILLSDGQGTCGSIRPAGVYNSAPLQRNRHIMVDAKQCGGGISNSSPAYVSYYTVGFNIAPGSPAERDLQYLSQLSGGKYLNVQNQTQLTRAFRKFNRTYQPKRYPKLNSLPSSSTQTFLDGVRKIREDYFDEALEYYTQFVKDHPDDCHGVYNLAISQEANDYLKEAIDNYQQYLSLCPSATDRAFVEKQIKFLEEEFRDFVIFQREVVQSDLAFLRLHFERIQNGQSIALAEEFKGFLREKGDYYERLPRLIASDDPFLQGITEEVSSALLQCKSLIRRNPEKWDQDAIPLISMTYLNLKDLLEEL